MTSQLIREERVEAGGRQRRKVSNGDGCSQLAKSSEGAPLLGKLAGDFVVWQFPG